MVELELEKSGLLIPRPVLFHGISSSKFVALSSGVLIIDQGIPLLWSASLWPSDKMSSVPNYVHFPNMELFI